MPLRRHLRRAPSGSVPGGRALVALVLVGYLLLLNGTVAGRGWHLLVHLVTEHGTLPPFAAHHEGHEHEHEASPGHPVPHDHEVGHEAHGYHATHHAHEDHTVPHDTDGHGTEDPHAEDHDADPVWGDAPHAHHGHVHVHHGADSPPVTPVAVVDKHCLFQAPVLLPPTAARTITAAPQPVRLFVASTVETPPPRPVG